MAIFAAASDVADAWRPLTAAETSVATTLVAHAHTLVYHHIPELDALVASGEVDAGLVKLAIVQMVVRVLRNPDALEGERLEEWSVTYADEATGLLEFTDAERKLVRPKSTVPRTRVRSVRVRPGLM